MVKGQYMVLYPRSYNKRGQEHLHSAQGVTSEGEVANVKLRIDDATRLAQGDMVATIAELSRTDRKAKMACIHSEDNGPDKREGVLLFENVKPDSKPGNFISSNAYVLAEHSEKVSPVIGLGRMDIKKDTQNVKKAQISLRTELARPKDMQNAKRIEQLEADVANPINFNYRAIIYQFESAILIIDPDPNKLLELMAKAIDDNTRSGITGGVLIKPLDQENRVIENLCHEHFTMFDIKATAYQSGVEATGVYLRTVGKKLWSSDMKKLLIIPLSRYNCGPLGNKDCGKNYDQIMAQFFEDDIPLVSRVALSLSYFADRDNTLLYKLFPISPSLGRSERLSSSGRMTDLFQGEKGEIINILDSEVIERPIGLFSFNSFPIEKLSSNVTSLEKEEIANVEQEPEPIVTEQNENDNKLDFEIADSVDIFSGITDDVEEEVSEKTSDESVKAKQSVTNLEDLLEPSQDSDNEIPEEDSKREEVPETAQSNTEELSNASENRADTAPGVTPNNDTFVDILNELIDEKAISVELTDDKENDRPHETETVPKVQTEEKIVTKDQMKVSDEHLSIEIGENDSHKTLSEPIIDTCSDIKAVTEVSSSPDIEEPKKELSGMMAFLKKKKKS